MASRLGTREKAGLRATMRCWGDFAVHEPESGTDLRPRGRKARALLAYLAMHPDKPVSREKLTGLFWGERADEQARASLRQSLFELRELSRGAPPLLHVGREAVKLAGDAIETDIDRWKVLVAEGKYDLVLADLPDPDETLFANLDGVDRGFDEWLQVERTRQHDALIALIADASAAALTEGQTRAARALHARLTELNPQEPPAAPAPSDLVAAMPVPVAVPSPRRTRRVAFAAALLLAASAVGGTAWYQLRPAAASNAGREVHELTETARKIIYDRKGSEYPVAISLLRRALQLQPHYAPALANLAAAIEMNRPSKEGRVEAERLARRAIELDPKFAFGHGVLGMVLGFEPAEARAAIKRAAVLDSGDPQIQFWLSNVLGSEGDYVGRLQALRRAAAIDPLWHRASGSAALAAWELGHWQEAKAYAERLREIDLQRSFECGYAIDWARGDYSGVVHDTLASRQRLVDAEAADWKLGIAFLALGHEQEARLLLRLPPPLWRIASGAGPAPGEIEPLMIEAMRDDRADFFALSALRQLLKAGRAAEIVAAYDRRVGVLGQVAALDGPSGVKVTNGLQVALALRAVGRRQEADALLNRADAAIRTSLSHGAIPNWMYASAAGVWAAQGRKEEAVAALQTAIDRGWHYAPMTPLPDIGDIPSFASLRGDARFERLRQRLKDHIQRERRELGALPV